MEYRKAPLCIDAQADRLIERGLMADRALLIRRLQVVNYYRLSGYLHPFRLPESDRYREGATFGEVWDRYCFDRRLRVLMLDVIERIEVAIRTRLVFHFTHAHGPFGYLDARHLPKLKIEEYLEWRTSLLEETSRSKETFREHFFKRYGDHHQELPLWMLAELMSMGSLLTFLKGVAPEFKQKVAADLGLVDETLFSWLRSLYGVRNGCAHHARLWNRVLGYPPILPNKSPFWTGENKPGNQRCGVILLICRHLLALIDPGSRWPARVEALFAEYPAIPLADMGLADNWRQHPVWNQPRAA
jgi:abortive infection bacteriophage resistance protein